MAEPGRLDDAANEDTDKSGTFWHFFRKIFGKNDDQSLRAQLQEVIDEHEDDEAENTPIAGDMSPLELEMLRNLLHFSEHDAGDIAIPRSEITAISTHADWEDVITIFAEQGHSRIPVYQDTLDEIAGMILIKDVFHFLARGEKPDDWNDLIRQPLFVPQARGALDVLGDMRASRTHLAIVVDEYSGTDGIITIEDLVEEIVGEIEDEHDDAAPEPLTLLDNGSWDADARAELEDVAKRIDSRLGKIEEDVDTIGGLAIVLAGHVPQIGSVIQHESGWRMEIIDGNDTHVIRMRLHPPDNTAPLPE